MHALESHAESVFRQNPAGENSASRKVPLIAWFLFGLGALACSSDSDAGPDGVEPPGEQDEFSSKPWPFAIVGRPYFDRAAVSGDGAEVAAFSLVDGPAGMEVSIDGEVAWTPDSSQTGSHRVHLRAILGDQERNQVYAIDVAELETISHAVIGPEGGVVRIDNFDGSLAGTAVEIEPGRVVEPTTVMIERVVGASVPYPSHVHPLSDAFVITPAEVAAGAHIRPPAGLELPPGESLFVSVASLGVRADGEGATNVVVNMDADYTLVEKVQLAHQVLFGPITFTSLSVRRLDADSISVVWSYNEGDPDSSDTVRALHSQLVEQRRRFGELGCETEPVTTLLVEEFEDDRGGRTAGGQYIFLNRRDNDFETGGAFEVMAHEYFHTIQARMVGPFPLFPDHRDWWLEATAEYAGGLGAQSQFWMAERIPSTLVAEQGLYRYPSGTHQYDLAWFFQFLQASDGLNICGFLGAQAPLLDDRDIYGALDAATGGGLQSRLMDFGAALIAYRYNSIIPNIDGRSAGGPILIAKLGPGSLVPKVIRNIPFRGALTFAWDLEVVDPIDIKLTVSDGSGNALRTALTRLSDPGASIEELTMIAGSSGEVTVKDIPAGRIAVTAADGRWNFEDSSIHIELLPLMKIQGVVSDSDGKPAPADAVTITLENGQETFPVSLEGDGSFEVEELPTDNGPYVLTAFCDGSLEPGVKTIPISLDGVTQDGTLQIPHPCVMPIEIASHEDGATVGNDRPLVFGTFEPGATEIEIETPLGVYPASTTGNQFYANVDLEPGDNAVTARAKFDGVLQSHTITLILEGMWCNKVTYIFKEEFITSPICAQCDPMCSGVSAAETAQQVVDCYVQSAPCNVTLSTCELESLTPVSVEPLRETFTALIQCYEADGEPEMDINGDPKPREVGFAVDFK